MTDDFLARWSRRKLGGRAAPEEGSPKDSERGSQADAPAPRIADETMTPEEIAALPAISDITLETDITAFLRRGVPAALRNAALQRLWVLDPDIRNFVGEARDYAWDWNTPGGVPVSGPIESGTDIPAMLRRVFGEESETTRENVIASSETAPPPLKQEQPASSPASATEQAAQPAESGIPSVKEDSSGESAPVRRHGSALPV
jgi:Protein of unknown function (DUF3306)